MKSKGFFNKNQLTIFIESLRRSMFTQASLTVSGDMVNCKPARTGIKTILEQSKGFWVSRYFERGSQIWNHCS